MSDKITSFDWRNKFILAAITLVIAFISGIVTLCVPERQDTNNAELEIFFSIFGLVYAIVIGLFVIEGHRRMTDLCSLIHNEINSVDDILDFLVYYEESEQSETIDEIKKELLMLALSLKTNLNHLYEPNRQENWRRMVRKIIVRITKLKISSESSKIALEGLIRKVADLTTFRSQTMGLLRRGFRGEFYTLMAFMAIVVIIGMTYMSVSDKVLHSALNGIIATLMWLLGVLVWDLDHPRKGSWTIYNEIEEYISELDDRIRQQKR